MFGYTKSCDDVVKEKYRSHGASVVQSRNLLDPLGKVIDVNDDVCMTFRICGSIFHELDPPLVEETSKNY